MSHSQHHHEHSHGGHAHEGTHKSSDERLVYMANQIATFFSTQPHAEAVDGTRQHIRKFWDPRMRGRVPHLLAEHPSLLPIAREALEGLPTPAHN